jgi:release factor glutamine methyltransferase
VQQLVVDDAAKLAAALALDVGSARLEVQYLLQHVLKRPRAWLLAHPETTLDPAQQSGHGAMLQRRLQGEPMAYILGEREFFGLTFRVTPATLIPRPETELLVELALERMAQERICRVLDLGTGSGAIALSIAQARPEARVTAVDASADALAVARENARRLLGQSAAPDTSVPAEPVEARLSVHNATIPVRTGAVIGNVCLLQSEWFSGLAGEKFDLIVANPPYVAADDPHLTMGDLRFEPASALVAGPDGLDDIRRIVAEAPAHLEPGGWLLLEHGYDQAAAIARLLQAAGLSDAFTARDLAGIERVSGARHSG